MARRRALHKSKRARLSAVLLMVGAIALVGLLSPNRGSWQDGGSAQTTSVSADRIVSLGKGTIILAQGLEGLKIVEWIKSDRERDLVVALGNETFDRDSTALSSSGSTQLANLAHMLRAHPQVAAQLALMSRGDSADSRLLRSRAEQVRADLTRHEIQQSRVTVVRGDFLPSTLTEEIGRAGEDGPLLLILSSRRG